MAERDGRPKAWGVLAVSLALMALVAALSSTTGHRTVVPSTSVSARRPTREGVAHRSRSSADPADSLASSVTTTPHRESVTRAHAPVAAEALPRRGPVADLRLDDTTSTSAVADASRLAGSETTVGAAVGLTTPSAADVTAIAPAATPLPTKRGTTGTPSETSSGSSPGTSHGSSSGASSTGTSAATAASPTHHGTLAYPVTSFTVSAPGGSTVNANATWSGTATMQLTITCPDGVSSSRIGGSDLSLEVDDTAGGPGQCDVRLNLPPGVRADVTFTLTVEPVA